MAIAPALASTVPVVSQDGAASSETPSESAGDPAHDWPQFRQSPSHSAFLDNAIPTGGLEERWCVTVEGYPSEPVIADGTVYISSEAGLTAIDLETGNTEWVRPPQEIDSAEEPQRPSAPVVVGETLIVQEGDGRLVALSPDGEARWTETYDGRRFLHPVVIGESILFESTTRLYSISVTDGTVQWKHEDESYTGLPTVHDGTVYVYDLRSTVHAIDRATGETNWTTELDVRIEALTSTCPLVDDDRVYLRTGGKRQRLRALERDSGRTLWTSEPKHVSEYGEFAIDGSRIYARDSLRGIFAIDTETGETVWQTGDKALDITATMFASDPIVTRNVVFVMTQSGVLWGLDPETGEKLFTEETGLSEGSVYPLIVTEAGLIVAEADEGENVVSMCQLRDGEE